MTLTIYFLRHGETVSSKIDSFCGTSDVELTPEGKIMAKDFAAAYSTVPWKAIFSSPMIRTMATAKPLCDLIGMEMQLRDGLKEIDEVQAERGSLRTFRPQRQVSLSSVVLRRSTLDFGAWENKTKEEVDSQFHDEYVRWQCEPGWNSPTLGERAIDIARRSSEVIEEIEKTYRDGNVLIVSHKATIRIMLCSLLGIDVGRYRDRIYMPVAAVTVVEFCEQGPLLKKRARSLSYN